MRESIRILGLLSLLCVSFYTTNQLALFMKEKDPIYQSILVLKEDYESKPFDATILDRYIIPGYNGETIDLEKSYKKMHQNGVLEQSKLVYEARTPSVTLKNHKDKIIFQGNLQKGGVSLLIDSEEFSTYFDELGISYTILTTKENVSHHYAFGEKVNSDEKNYDELEKILKKKGEQLSYCYVNKVSEESCFKHGKYLFLESKKITNANYLSLYKNISSGDILYLDKNLNRSYLKSLLSQIEFKGFKILPLSKFLSEERF
ncbi:MAG: hypothetical protein IJ743_02445 [Bacilli bacterium]|nr:hypothetical protein [Bacilli bacterium]MBR1748639.1 hypothetical protein [Bacilli bacterium]MBR1817212.1 hypothetical protein [Bacilli bacterium]